MRVLFMNGLSFFLLLSCISFPVFAMHPCITHVFDFLLKQNNIRSTSPAVLDIFNSSKGVECLQVPRNEPKFSYKLVHDIRQLKEDNMTVDKINNGELFIIMQKMVDARKPEHRIDINELQGRLSTCTTEPSKEDQTPAVQSAISCFVIKINHILRKHNNDVILCGLMEMADQANNPWK